jgi:serine/threonine-protein kinase HipA
MNSLRLQKTWSLPCLDAPIAAAKFSDPEPAKAIKATKIGRSPLLGQR